ncbi:MAG: carboxypeptidase-like regulatory domain-containing protein [Prevotellaceae bacterium]|jgi:hypothetical protein|nr:carboxypeptidase-like regulatory domain-containing protein [Prevotellaceae bacterium]
MDIGVQFERDKLGINMKNEWICYSYKDIFEISSDCKRTVIQMSTGRVHRVDVPLKIFEENLPVIFFKYRKSGIINLAYIKRHYIEDKKKTTLLRIIAIVSCQIFFASAFAQHNVKGVVTDTNSVSIAYFNVEVLSIDDSSVVKGGTFVNGEFAFDNLAEDKYYLKISSLGYSPLITELDAKSLNKNTFQLKHSKIQLDEVVIGARMPKIKNRTDGFVIEIENSSLGDAGNALNVLGRTPFVIIDRLTSEITVAGKGNAIIRINNRRVANQELEMLNSQDIKQIEVIENPSAKYEAEGHSVINIITRKNRDSGINVSLQSNYTRGRHNSAKFQGSLTYVTNKIVLFSQYGYTHRNSEGFNFSDEHYEKAGYSFHLKEFDLNNEYKTRLNNYSLGISYNPAKNHSLGLKYDGYFGNVSHYTVRQIEAERNATNIPDETMKNEGADRRRYNGMNFNYNFANGGYEISIVGDYISSVKNSSVKINETDKENTYSRERVNDWDAKYDLFSVQIDAKFPIASLKSSLEAGLRASLVKSENDNRFMNLVGGAYIKDDKFSGIIFFDETIASSYFLLK